MTDLSSYKANLENYLTSFSILKTMQKRNILSNNDYKTAEENLCEIHCINKLSIYRELAYILAD